jgi:hypothetical protein
MVEDDYYDSGDRRLLRLGIDPDSDSLEIYLELKRRIAERVPEDSVAFLNVVVGVTV